MLEELMPQSWRFLLSAEFEKDYFRQLESFLAEEISNHQVFPSREDIFAAFRYCDYPAVRVVILGQDPYHDDGQAHGLCFSVPDGIALPPSLRNIFRELSDDCGTDVPSNGSLISWAGQGILLLNTVLTVRAHQANSHKDKGWETFTDSVISLLNRRDEPVVFVLWGSHAQKKTALIDCSKHHVICSAHPSPLSAYRGFFGSRPFSKINKLLEKPVNWKLQTGKTVQCELF